MTDTRLSAWTPNGSKLGPLPTPLSLDASYVLNDTGALSFQYPLDGALSSLLGTPLEIVTEVSVDDGLTWAEPKNGRFLYLTDARDPIKLDAYQADCPSYIQRLTKGLVPFTGLDANGQRTFTAATPGKILNDLFTEAQARGALTGITWTFGAVNDTSGTAWPVASQQTIGFNPGQNFYEILTGLADAGLIDFCTNGREIQVYIADVTTGMAVDRSIGANPVTLRPGQGLTEAPFRRTWSGVADTAYVQGDGTANLIRTNGAAITPWGRQETFVTASGVTDAGTLQTVADGALSQTDTVRIERTFGLTFASAVFHPFGQYGVGEYVFAVSDGTVAAERLRVRQITLTRDNNGVAGGNAVLNDRFVEADIRAARALTKLTGGATPGGSGSSPIGNDILPPGAVGVVTTSSSAYVDIHGDVKATLGLDWPDVTLNSDGTSLTDLDHYDVERRRSGETTWTMVSTVNLSQWSDSPYEPNETWEFRVRAVDKVYNRGAYSSVVAKTTASDVTGPVAPSQPSASSSPANAAAIIVGWDGKNNVGAAMDADLSYVEVHVSTTNGFTATGGNATTLKATLDPGPGTVTIGGLVEGTVYYVVLKGRDTSGNYGAQSVQRAVTASRRTDGAVPSAAPANTVLNQFAVGALEARWDAVTNADPVTYDVYLAAGAAVGGVYNSTTFIGSTTATSLPITRVPAGTLLLPDTDYYLEVRVRDGDGYALTSSTAGPTRYRKADVTTISAGWIYAGGIEATQIKTGTLAADLVVGKTLSAGDGTGRQVTMSPDGLIVTDSGGNPVASFPTALTSDISLNANILAQTLTASGLAQFNDMLVNRNRTMTLAKGIQPPTSPVQVTNSWPSVTLATPPAAQSPYGGSSPTPDAAFYDAAAGNMIVVWAEGPDAGDAVYVTVETRNRTTGALISTLFQTVSSFSGGVRGVVKIGSFIYLLWTDGGTGGDFTYDTKVSKFSTAGVLQSSWAVATARTGAPTMGVDGANVIMGYIESNLIKFGTYNPDTGAQVTAPVSTGVTYTTMGGAPASIAKVTADVPVGAPATRVIMPGPTQTLVTTTAGAREANSEWLTDTVVAGGTGPTVWDSTGAQWKRFTGTVAANSSMVTYAGDNWAGATTRTVRGTATYYDNNATGGVHETVQGPIATLTHKKRASVTAAIDSLPAPSTPPTTDDANSWNLYLGTGTGVRTTQYLVGTTGGTALGQTVNSVLAAGTNPPLAGNFPNQVAAKVQSADALYYFDGTGRIRASNMTGIVVPFAGSAAPAGTVLCDGASYLRTDYPELFALIGVTYGSVDGTHFNVPDLRGRVPAGVDGTTEFLALNTKAGAKTVTLTAAQIPQHTHDMSHTHSNPSGNVIGSAAFLVRATAASSLGNIAGTNAFNGNTDGGTGGGGAHNNVQPSIALNFIIYT